MIIKRNTGLSMVFLVLGGENLWETMRKAHTWKEQKTKTNLKMFFLILRHFALFRKLIYVLKSFFCFSSIEARAIKEDVGYPPYIKDDSKLDTHYSTVSNHPHTRFVFSFRLLSLHEIHRSVSMMLYSYNYCSLDVTIERWLFFFLS